MSRKDNLILKFLALPMILKVGYASESSKELLKCKA